MLRRILFVDDDADTRSAIVRLLRGEGFHVEVCAEGLEALERLRRAPYDVVVTDHLMPEMNGLDLVRTVRQSGERIGCVVVSAQDPPSGVEREVHWLDKPVDADELVAAIQAA